MMIAGNALDATTFVDTISPADTFVHLIGTPHPSPGKAPQFRDVELVSVEAAVTAATRAGVRHFVYLSVAQPAPIMREYIAVRQQGEALIRSGGSVPRAGQFPSAPGALGATGLAACRPF
jgi:uncharacterized protein YbjT (DUF2867 family)